MRTWVLLFSLFFCCHANALAQQYDLEGNIVDEKAVPLAYTTVSLLNPADSTLAFFGITNEQGLFHVKGITNGEYLLQVAMLGFSTYYQSLSMPMLKGNNIGVIVLKETPVNLHEVEVNAEKIPLMLKGDTLEYNAAAYKVKPDANVEDLLRKLPGVQVDKAGNIKAQGKDVQRVTVDGKDFFSNDPKVATKNLPADAINKVQVFDRHSDQSAFTGIDDGTRDKTINLTLKDDKKHGYFGDVQAGYGSGDHYQFGGKLYRFAKKSQFSALGMVNNINQFGFTLEDYLSFNGGMRGLMNGNGSLSLRIDGSMPVNFGQQVTGLVTSGAGGINYSYEPRENNTFNISYMGNGAGKDLKEQTNTKNYTGSSTFIKDDNTNEHSENWGHKLNFSWRNEIDSTKQLLLNGTAALSTSATNRDLYSASYISDLVLNRLQSTARDKGNDINGNVGLSYLKKYQGNWPVFKVFADGSFDKGLTNTQWNNATTYFDTIGHTFYDDQYRDDHDDKYTYSLGASVVRRLGRGYYTEPEIKAANDEDHILRSQGYMPREAGNIDSLSPDYGRTFRWIKPGLGIKKSNDKVQFNAALGLQLSTLSTALSGTASRNANYYYLLPSVLWQKEYGMGRHIGLSYTSAVNAPGVQQMLPVANTVDPLYITTGNRSLKPEYSHTFNVNWLRFDQFSFTSLFANLTFKYTHDKINWARTVNSGLGQSATLVNVPGDYDLRGRAEFSTPVRKLGIDINMSFDEQYNKGINPVNGINNNSNTFTHSFELGIDNRKKDKWDAEVTGFLNISDASYSIERSLNNTFYNYGGKATLSYKPTDHWYFMASADLDIYDARSFDKPVSIPLLKAAASYYFLKAKRGVLTFDAFDILNRNTGLTRIAQLNYLQEKRSDIIGRYFMLSFKYRLNKTGGNAGPGAIHIDMK
ncbi:MAG: hypothetical protein BGO69_19835 [Bacteroidetes bacterium 46-16]|nr:MAG: hypothetical protein BGO69_19835 [Bacteroidetes bacterium 46-16]